MIIIKHTLLYLQESLANYSGNGLCQKIIHKLESNHYRDEEEFVKELDEEELSYLDSVLKREINYAKNVQDLIRVEQLTEVYELIL